MLEQNLIKCEICGQLFSNRQIVRHIHSKHNIDDKQYYDMYIRKQDEGFCVICGKETKFYGILKGYPAIHCSPKCTQLDSNVRQAYKDTCKKKYGVDSYSKTDQFKNKREETCLLKYGAINNSCTYEYKMKYKQTCNERYGCDNPMQSDDIKLKVLNTKLEKYDNMYYNNPQKIKQTKLDRYGDENYNNYNKAKQTCLDLYGVENCFQSDIKKAAAKQTKLEKYGDANYVNPDKAKSTKLEKYGDENYNNREKCQQTCFEKYGVNSYSKTSDFQIECANSRSKVKSINGLRLDSLYEKLVYDFYYQFYTIERNIPIQYIASDGSNHITYIDFKINDKLIEVKGSHLLSGVFDYAGVPICDKLKVYQENKVIIITDIGGQQYLNDNITSLDICWFNVSDNLNYILDIVNQHVNNGMGFLQYNEQIIMEGNNI